jgi:hypothetical protein
VWDIMTGDRPVPDSPKESRPRLVPEVWGRVPPRNKNFTGREELLDRLHHGIVGSDVAVVLPHALHGFGGVGKTQVAIEYAWRHRSEYDLVWWISADQPILVRSALAAMATRLGMPPADATGIDDAAAAVLDALRRGEPYSRWLLVFDNADRPEDISDVIPRDGPGHVLVTSRNHRWQGVVDTVPVDVFDRLESIAFLSKRAARTIAPEDADRLAQELGDLPLALEQAGALQAETGMSIDEYLQLLKEQATLLLAEGKPSEYPVSMTAAWSLSVSQLRERLPEAVDLLRCCAFFGPEPIPRDVFAPVVDASGLQTPATGSPLGPLLANPILLWRAIAELGRYALAKIDTENRTIQVHRLVQTLLREELDTAERERFQHEVHLLLAAAAPKEPEDTADWERYVDLLAHTEPADVAGCADRNVRGFSLDAVRYLYISGDYRTARSSAERLIGAWSPESGENDRQVLMARKHLGDALRELGEYTVAYELNRLTLDRMNEALGPDDASTLVLANSHGADLRARGDFQAARDHDESSHQRHLAAFGTADRRTLRALNNLAADYTLISDYKSARRLYLETFQLQRIPGPWVGAVDQLFVRNGLARAVRLSGEYAEAVDLGEDGFAFGKKELGREHPWTLRTAKDLSIAQRRVGATEEALELAQDTYEREARVFGDDHADTLAAAMNLSNALRTLDRVDEGYPLAVETMRLYPPVYGQDHPYNQGCAVNLALLERVRGEPEEAARLDRAALAGLTTRVGRRHHYTLTCALNLASDLAALGDSASARELGERTRIELVALLGEHHPLTVACSANLVHDLRAEGRGEEADRLADETLEHYAGVLGLAHPDAQAFRDGRRLDFDFDPPPI